MRRTVMSAGLTPPILPAWPKVCGLTCRYIIKIWVVLIQSKIQCCSCQVVSTWVSMYMPEKFRQDMVSSSKM
jgi:hypothetical protein